MQKNEQTTEDVMHEEKTGSFHYTYYGQLNSQFMKVKIFRIYTTRTCKKIRLL